MALPKGDYLIPPDPTASALDQSLNAICNTLWIKQGMVLAGRGAGETTLHFGIEMEPGADGALLQLEGFSVVGASVEIGGRGLQKVRLSRLRIDLPDHIVSVAGTGTLYFSLIGDGNFTYTDLTSAYVVVDIEPAS